MHLTALTDPSEFTERVLAFLQANEAVHNLLLSILADLSGGRTFGVANPLLSFVEDETGVRAVGVGLDHFVPHQEEQAKFLRRHPHDKGFGGVQDRAQTAGNVPRIDWFAHL